jgi:hypothetical protein
MDSNRDRNLNLVAALGLAVGAVLGMAGTMVHQASLRGLFWGIDGAALVVATSLLTLKYYKKGCIFVAAGFLVYTIGEALILPCSATSLAASVPFFGAGAALWALGLLLISIPAEFLLWARLTGIAAFVLFLLVALRIFHGEQILATSSPLPFYAYPLLVLTFLGWIWTLLRENLLKPTGE